MTKKLTLNLALRWDLISMYNDVNNHQSNLNLDTGLLDVATAGNRGPNVDTNYRNFAPRVGFAYSPDNGRTAIRGAWGITNFPDHYGAAGGTLERNWPWFEEYVLGQQVANTPWAALSSPQNLPNPSCAAKLELVPDRTAGLCSAAVLGHGGSVSRGQPLLRSQDQPTGQGHDVELRHPAQADAIELDRRCICRDQGRRTCSGRSTSTRRSRERTRSSGAGCPPASAD